MALSCTAATTNSLAIVLASSLAAFPSGQLFEVQTALATDDAPFNPFLSSLSTSPEALVTDLLPGTRYLLASRSRSPDSLEWTNLTAPIECTTAPLKSGQPRVLPPQEAPSHTSLVVTVVAEVAEVVVEVRRTGVGEPWREAAAVHVGHGKGRTVVDGLKPATSYDVRASTSSEGAT